MGAERPGCSPPGDCQQPDLGEAQDTSLLGLDLRTTRQRPLTGYHRVAQSGGRSVDSTHHWREPVSALILTLLVALTAACKRGQLPQAASGERGGLHREPREYGTEKASIPSDST